MLQPKYRCYVLEPRNIHMYDANGRLSMYACQRMSARVCRCLHRTTCVGCVHGEWRENHEESLLVSSVRMDLHSHRAMPI